MKAKKFVLIYFETVKAKRSTQGKLKKIPQKKVNSRLNHGGKTQQIHLESV